MSLSFCFSSIFLVNVTKQWTLTDFFYVLIQVPVNLFTPARDSSDCPILIPHVCRLQMLQLWSKRALSLFISFMTTMQSLHTNQKAQTDSCRQLLTIVSHPAGMNAPSADSHPCYQITPNWQTDYFVHKSIFFVKFTRRQVETGVKSIM